MSTRLLILALVLTAFFTGMSVGGNARTPTCTTWTADAGTMCIVTNPDTGRDEWQSLGDDMPEEDEPAWNCQTMGNRQCGDLPRTTKGPRRAR